MIVHIFLKDKRKTIEELVIAKGEAAVTRLEPFGGYILKPNYYEFWQGQSDHIDDRMEFRKSGNDWEIHRLSP
ncbi:unnamed protein product [Strongylus vulgaris]|uniref:Pyridoxine 5'-phosphate oxidase dimerisation C-terminal domain-containing protein n=1 Tax=Strongylus vulgaris TaxID=40348 RepID=A0A3P7IXV5_STRVU|nr:unnamed protein product [Strongylus vulgaris]